MAAKGGENPELQVTDHGSDIACMQTGRGRKKYIGLGGKKIPPYFFQVDDYKRQQSRFRELDAKL